MKSQINQEVARKIQASQSFLITSHIRPDADAVGSMLGLGLALIKQGKTVQMVLEDEAESYAYLPGFAQVVHEASGKMDMTIVVDCSELDRVGSVLNGYPQPDLVVDHHKTNKAFGAINVIEPEQVATAVILFDRLPAWGLSIDPDVATCLLAAIVGDTIGFRTANVNADVLRKSAALIDLGGDLAHVYNEELVMRSYTAIHYWGYGLQRLKRKGSLVWSSLTLADRLETGYDQDDDANLVNILSSVREAKIAIIFVEQPDHSVKISWRSCPEFDVSVIATEFGGGGHAAAAGADVSGALAEVEQQVVQKTFDLIENKTKETGA